MKSWRVLHDVSVVDTHAAEGWPRPMGGSRDLGRASLSTSGIWRSFYCGCGGTPRTKREKDDDAGSVIVVSSASLRHGEMRKALPMSKLDDGANLAFAGPDR